MSSITITNILPADQTEQRKGSPGHHIPYSETLPHTSKTNSLAPASIASQGQRSRSNSTAPTSAHHPSSSIPSAEQRKGSPGHYTSYGDTLPKTNSSASSSIASQEQRTRSGSTASVSSSLHLSSSITRKNSAAPTDENGQPFLTYSATKPTSTTHLAPTATFVKNKGPIQETEGSEGAFFVPYSKPPAHPSSASGRLNPNPNQLPHDPSKRQYASPAKQAKTTVVSSDHHDGTSILPQGLQFMSLESPGKKPLLQRSDRSPSPSHEEINQNGRMSRGLTNSSPSPSRVPSESGFISPSFAMLMSSASEIFSSTPSSTTPSASSVSPTSASPSPISPSSTPSPHETASKAGYVSYTEGEKRQLPPMPNRKLTEKETLERSEKVISGLTFSDRVVRRIPSKSCHDTSSSSTAPSEKPISPHETAAKAPYVKWNNVDHASSSASKQETTKTDQNQK